MPYQQPTIHFQSLRSVCEKWTWLDPRGITVTGFNPPPGAQQKRQKPFYIKYITKDGKAEEGEVICLKVNLRRHQRMVKFCASGEIRMVCDILIREVEGLRVVAG